MLKNVQEELNRFAKYVIQQSRTNLTKGKKNSSKELYNSLDSNVKVSKNSFELTFLMEDYGIFQDKGVKGTKSNYLENKDSPFSYKESSKLVGVEYHTGTFAKWAKRKGVQFRNKKGRYVTHEQTGYMLANIIKKKGVKASMFFTKPFKKAFNNLDKDIVKAFRLDVEALIKNSIRNGN